MSGLVDGAKRRIVESFSRHLQKVANRHAAEVRDLQTRAGRNERMLIRIDVFERDVSQAGFIPQEVYTKFVRVVDGKMEMASEAASWGGRVRTDVPVLLGLRTGRMVKNLEEGGIEVIDPFTPKRAWGMGRILTDGDAMMLSNLLLFEKRVWSDLLREIKPDDGPAG